MARPVPCDRKRSKSSPIRTGSTAVMPEAVTDGRVGRRTPTLTEDAPFATEADELPHREEVAAVVQLADQGQLPVELAPGPSRGIVATRSVLPRPVQRERAVATLKKSLLPSGRRSAG